MPTISLRTRAVLLALLLLSLAWPASPAGVVVADDPLAAQVGARVLQDGGNAVDAAVATSFALAVTFPQAGNLGGGGFLLYRGPDGPRGWAIDFREEAPGAATADMFLGRRGKPVAKRSQKGPLSVGVPGSVAGLLLAHRRFGSMPRQRLLQPAIRLARDGFTVSAGLAEAMLRYRERLQRQAYARGIFQNHGRPFRAGEILRQPDLARTLERIALRGEDGFYRDDSARALLATLGALGGNMALEDLALYRPEERPALRGSYHGLEILTVPAPSAGGVALVEMLHILDGFDLPSRGPATPETLHLLASAMKLAFFDRNRYVGDPDYVSVPTSRLTSPDYATTLRRRIPERRTLPSGELGSPLPQPRESSETTHLSVLDTDGHAVSLTTTLNSTFGSGLAAEGLGYLLNNEMDDFTTAPGHPNLYGLVEGRANLVAAGKRMASSMSPTIVLRDGAPLLVLGSPGGPRIPNAVLQVLVNILDFDMELQEAVDAPRMHHQWLPDVVQFEENRWPPQSAAAMQAMGYSVGSRDKVGNVLAAYAHASGLVEGAADARSYGAVATVP